MAFEYPNHPEDNTYTVWDGIPGSGGKRISKEKYEELAKQVRAVKIIRGNPVKIVDDIS